MSREVADLTTRVVAGVREGDPAEIKKPKDFLPPVAWLFGRDYIAAFKWMLVYAAFKGKLDPRDWMNANVIPEADPRVDPGESWLSWGEAARDAAAGEFWFDYISDTGDGQKAVYSIAYLCMSDLAAGGEPQLGDEIEFVAQPDRARLEAEGKQLLPRGTFLLVGGDTSYHIADYAALAERFWNPFRWAYKDLAEGGAASVLGGAARPLVGIPGNHDYYDSLDGFNRQFRRPSTGEANDAPGSRPPQLAIPTFERVQEASYVALRLPFGWWFWGMDTEEGEIDFRQQEFFKGINANYAPKKLIVATPEPTTVFGKRMSPDSNQSKTFAALGLERPFLKDGEQIGAGKCRLDLSGDIHHYARHWGTPRGTREARNYASVMAGGGGAFFHPTQTTIREVQPEVIYPAPAESRRKVADQLFKLRNIWQGGYVWLFGAIIAFVVFFAASFPQSSRDAFDSFPPFVDLGVSTGRLEQPAVSYVRQMPRAPWWTDAQSAPGGYFLAVVLLGLSLALLVGALAYSAKLFAKEYDPTWSKPRKVVTLPQRVVLWAMVFASFACFAFGIGGLQQPESMQVLTRFGRSIIILVGLVWSVLAVVESLRYSEWLFEEAHHRPVMARHSWPLWVLIVMSVLGFGSSVWFFGKHESAYLFADILLLLVVALVFGGLTFFAFSTGGGLKKGAGKLGFLLLGASHGLLQLAVPFLLVRKGHLVWAMLATLLVVVVFKFAGSWLAKKENGWLLALAWLALGAALLAVPFLLDATHEPVFFSEGINVPDGGWQRLALCLVAAAVGAVMSCVLFGWYLAVALAFNGHNNEAGGAARIEGFKQVVRVRLNRDGLTGYVIAFDEAVEDGRGGKFRPKIVDIFHLSER